MTEEARPGAVWDGAKWIQVAGVARRQSLNPKIDLPLNTLTGWTVQAGTWSINGDVIEVANGGASESVLRYEGLRLGTSLVIMECDVKIVSGGGSYTRVSLGMRGQAGASTGWPVVHYNATSYPWQVNADRFAAVGLGAGPALAGHAYGQWHRMRIHFVGHTLSVWMDGIQVYNVSNTDQTGLDDWHISLGAYNSVSQFKNLKVWDSATILESVVNGASGIADSSPWLLDTTVRNATLADDFTLGALDPKWTRYVVTSAEETFHDGWMSVAFAASGARQYHQPAPTGDFSIIMAMSQFNSTSNDDMMGPLIIDSSGAGVMFSPWSDGNWYQWSLSGYNYIGSPVSVKGPWAGIPYGQRYWVQMNKVGTSYKSRYSLDGVNWSPWTGTYTWSGTVDRIGFGHAYNGASGRMNIDSFNVV